MKPAPTKTKISPIAFEVGSGNIFRDIGMRNPEEALMKAKIAAIIGILLRRLNLSQAAAAEKLGIHQPKVSLLLRGQLKEFSVERLLRFLTALEQDITITIRPRKKGRRKEPVLVELAA